MKSESNKSPPQSDVQLETINLSILSTLSETISSITIKTRRCLADIAGEIEQEIEYEKFDYIKNEINYEELKQVFDRNKAQNEFIGSKVNRKAVFTSKELTQEVINFWQSTNSKLYFNCSSIYMDSFV